MLIALCLSYDQNMLEVDLLGTGSGSHAQVFRLLCTAHLANQPNYGQNSKKAEKNPMKTQELSLAIDFLKFGNEECRLASMFSLHRLWALPDRQIEFPDRSEGQSSHRGLSFERAHVFRVYLQRLLPRHIEGLLFDKGVLNVLRLRCLRKDWVVVDRTQAQFCHLKVMPLG